MPDGSVNSGGGTTAAIYEDLRRAICTLVYPFGTVLRADEIAAAFGVSRTPAREALQRLQNDGLVETRHGVGSRVIAGDVETMEEIYALRLEIAGLLGTLAPRPCDSNLVARLDSVREAARALPGSGDTARFWQVNAAGHRVLNGLTGNRELAQLHDLYYHKVAPFWFGLTRVDFDAEARLLVREQDELLFWARAGDPIAMASVHRNHVALGLSRVRRARNAVAPAALDGASDS